MIKLSGNLFIRAIHGRNGVFSVGRLVTDIGEFVIKDALLDQYEEGRYEGEFGVTKIFPASYLTGGRMVIEVRATLASIALTSIDELPTEQPALPDPDPIDSEGSKAETASKPAYYPEPEKDPVAPREAGQAAHSDDESDRVLFGELWPLEGTVKLDTTVDRLKFRSQKERLKKLGYEFQPLGQEWIRSEAGT